MKKFKSALLIAPLTLSLVSFDNVDAAPLQNDSEISQVDFSKTVSVLGSSPFKDVKADHFAYEAIQWAYQKGIINKDKNGNFNPNQDITEAEFIAIVYKYFNLNPLGISNIKKDNTTNSISDTYYNTMAVYEIPLNGYLNESLRQNPIKKGNVALVLANLIHSEVDLDDSISFLLDNNISSGVNYSQKDNIQKFFGSTDNLTKSEAIVMLTRMDKLGFNQLSKQTFNKGESNKKKDVNKVVQTNLSELDSTLRTNVQKSNKEIVLTPQSTKAVNGIEVNIPGVDSVNVTTYKDGKATTHQIKSDGSSEVIETTYTNSGIQEVKPKWKPTKLPISKNATADDISDSANAKAFKMLSPKSLEILKKNGYVIFSSGDEGKFGWTINFVSQKHGIIAITYLDELHDVFYENVNHAPSIVKDILKFNLTPKQLVLKRGERVKWLSKDKKSYITRGMTRGHSLTVEKKTLSY